MIYSPYFEGTAVITSLTTKLECSRYILKTRSQEHSHPIQGVGNMPTNDQGPWCVQLIRYHDDSTIKSKLPATVCFIKFHKILLLHRCTSYNKLTKFVYDVI